MPCTYFFDKTENIIYEDWQGPISIGDLLTFVKYNMETEGFPPGIRVILLAEDSPSFHVREITTFLNFLLSNRNQFQNARWAIVSNNTTLVAYMHIFKRISVILPIEIGVFSTVEAALYWQKLSEAYLEGVKQKASIFNKNLIPINN
jgi:hypothetical protein